MYYTDTYKSPLGEIVLMGDEKALVGLWFVGQEHFMEGFNEEAQRWPERRGARERCHRKETESTRGEVEPIRLAKEWLDQYFSGVAPNIKVPVRLVGTEFQCAVWRILATIPYGETMTYGEIAKKMEVESRRVTKVSARAVGNAVGRNKISLIIPCHRVIGADGSLTGYAGGVERKRRLLEGEKLRKISSLGR